MSTRKTFCAVGAVAVDVVDPVATRVMPVVNAAAMGEIDPNKLVTLDLAKRLRNVDWDKVIIDALGLHGDRSDKLPAAQYVPEDGIDVLTVGPVFPGQTVGGIYFERDLFYTKVRPLCDPTFLTWPDSDSHTYQVMSSATSFDNGKTVSRYHGFHARVLEDHGDEKLLGIKSHGKLRKVTVNMTKRSQCDDPVALRQAVQDPANPDNVEPVLDAGSRANEEGAVFLPLTTCVDKQLFSPKEPRSADGFLVPPFGGISEAPRFAGTTVLVGDGEEDDFVKSVFDHVPETNRVAKVAFTSNQLTRVRRQLLDVAARAIPGTSLDIVADAPTHIQRIGGNMVGVIFDDAWSSLDDDVVRAIRKKFAQCRLLGCFTAGDIDVRRGMLRLASVLRTPVVGTLRAISSGDFLDTGFREHQIIHGVEVKITLSTAEMMPSGHHVDPEIEKLIQSGRIQRDWLTTYPSIKLNPADFVTVPDRGVPTIHVSGGFFSSPMASTNDIQTAPIGAVALETPDRLRIRAEVLAGGTLLRFAAKDRSPLYLSLPHDGVDKAQLMAPFA